jgi:uncharacterized membrane protein
MATAHILVGASTSPAQPVVRHISPSDLYQSLARGIDDFTAMPSHALFLCVIYPLLGILSSAAAAKPGSTARRATRWMCCTRRRSAPSSPWVCC